jgi:membrane protein
VSTRPEPGARSARARRRSAEALRRIVSVLAIAIERYFADRCPQNAAGIAYRVLFSIVPLAIVLVSIFGVILGNQQIRQAVVDTVVSAVPPTTTGRGDVAKAISALASPSSAVGLLTLLPFLWAATGMMAAIRMGLDVALHVEHTRPPARGKLVDLALVVSCSLLVLATVAVTVLDKLAQHALQRVAAEAGLRGTFLVTWIPRPAAVITVVGIVMLLYRFLPSRRMRLSDALAGAITTALLLFAISFASGRIYDSVTHLSVVYGSLTTALVFLYSVYMYASALLFGGEVAAAWSAGATADGEPVKLKLRRALRGLFVGA